MTGQASAASELIAEIITGVRDIRYTQLVSCEYPYSVPSSVYEDPNGSLVVTATIVIYDYSEHSLNPSSRVRALTKFRDLAVVCLEREIELIWVSSNVVISRMDRPHASMQKKRWSVIKFAFLWVRPRPGETTEPRTIASHAPSLPASVLWAIVCDVSGRIPFMCRTGLLIAAFCVCAVCKYTVSTL